MEIKTEYPSGLGSLFSAHAREEYIKPILRYCRHCRGLMFHRFLFEDVDGRVFVCSCGHRERVR